MKGNTKLRRDNIKRLFCEIRDRGPVSKRELQELTGFSWGNISSITTELEENKFIMSVGKQKSSVGRRPEEYDVNITDNLIIGIDFSNVGFTAVVTDMRGRVTRSRSQDFEDETVDSALKKLYSVLKQMISELRGIKIRSIAFAMQGAVRDERVSAAAISGIAGWRDVPLADMIEERFGIKTVLIHDPDCIIRTEKHFGALQSPDINNALLVRIDHGVGMSIMSERRLYSGHDGKSGEIGHMIVPFDCEQGFSKLDSVVTEKSVVKNYKRLSGRNDDIACKEIADMARAGDAVCRELFVRVGTSLGIALANAVNLLYPERIVIFGSFSEYSDLYLGAVREVMEKALYDSQAAVTVSELGHDAAAVGAAIVASEKLTEELDFSE